MIRTKQFPILFAAGLLIICITSFLAAQQNNDKTPVVGTVHDINGQGCVGCHAPHQASAAGRVVLWARAFSTQVFGTYDSDTMNSSATEIGDPTYGPGNPPSGSKFFSVLCMSCHDGVTSPSLISATDGSAIGNPTNSDGLRNDHPVNILHDPTADPGLHPVATVTATNVRLFGGTVQCASCHDVHNGPGIGNFLRVANANSALCVTCHK